MNQKGDIARLLVEAIRRDSVSPAAGAICPEAALDEARRNRVAGLVGRHLRPTGGDAEWNAALASMERVYQANLLQALRGMKVAGSFLAAMKQAGIPCLGLRGLFAGEGLYGDPALRVFSDIDVLVPSGQRRQALAAAEAAGFRLAEALHAGFFERHHLHWRLEHGSGMAVELHWAVESPFSLRKVDCESLFRNAITRSSGGLTWDEPRPEHLLILLGLHTLKHCYKFHFINFQRPFYCTVSGYSVELTQ